jgi:hypothetical protein
VSATYEKQKRYQRRKATETADIGTIPAVKNPARRAACERNLPLFLTTYFPRSTGLKPFGPDHNGAIGRIQVCEFEGGYFGQAFPRGGAKTTISENTVLHAILYGHRDFAVLYGADANAASSNIDSIKLELAENDLLCDDFPEVCWAVRALEGKPQRCASQTHKPGDVEGWAPTDEQTSRQTHIEWRGDTIVLPTIYVPEGWAAVGGPRPGAKLVPSAGSGRIVTTRGIMGGSRGLKHKRPDGTQVRPDFVVLDDPQTDESASTALQVKKRLDVLRKNILRLGGHNKKLAIVMNATAIKPDDMVDQVSDPKKFPAWQFLRIKMVKAWGKSKETLWLTDYARLRNTYNPDILGDQQRAHREASAFYDRNRGLMDAGHEVFWEHCYDPSTERSAIQHAYNILIDDGEEVFRLRVPKRAAARRSRRPATHAHGAGDHGEAQPLRARSGATGRIARRRVCRRPEDGPFLGSVRVRRRLHRLRARLRHLAGSQARIRRAVGDPQDDPEGDRAGRVSRNRSTPAWTS